MLLISTRKLFPKKGLFLILSLFFYSTAFSAITLSPIFSSNMVLQRGVAVPIFGSGDPGSTVTVQFGSQSKTATVNATGKWRVDLAAMPASTAPSNLVVSSGSTTITLTGVQVGEVWVCSGQSNMGWPLSNANNSASTISTAGNHNIRLFRMTSGNGPATTTWQISNSSTVANFSAVGYWMGLELSQWLGNVPIGLIQATHDGTAIETWQHSSGGTGTDYDAMVKSIQPFAVRGVAWYQGESNGGDAAYASKLTNMIREWRADWGQTTLPFGIIQLAYRSGWNVARNAQLIVADTEPNCFLVVIRDLPGGSLHPTEKKPVGIRTAIGARGAVYGEAIGYSGAIRDVPNSYVLGNKVILKWKHVGNGLFTDNGAAPGEFKVATATGQFKTATAVIVGNTIELTNSTVATPARVQYSYSSVGNLYSSVNVPTEGGSVIVNRLKVSEFQINVSPAGGSLRSRLDGEVSVSSFEGPIFPNPSADGNFSINLSGKKGNRVLVRITDALGQEVSSISLPFREVLQVNSRLKKGIYFIKVTEGAEVLAEQKLAIQ